MARVEAVIRPVRPGDLEQLAATIRVADAAEVLASDGVAPLDGLRRAVAASVVSWSLELSGELAAMGGVVDGWRAHMLGPVELDEIWLLTGAAVDRHPLAYVRVVIRSLRELLRTSPALGCMVDARYESMLRLARLTGAEVRPAAPWGASSLPFHPVIWRS